MTSNSPLWRQAFDSVEHTLTPRVEAVVRSPKFTRGAALAVRAQAAARGEMARRSARVWHALNLPAGTDIVRLRSQIGAVDRELRRVSMRIEELGAAGESRPAPGDTKSEAS